jgi:hypothetical protein
MTQIQTTNTNSNVRSVIYKTLEENRQSTNLHECHHSVIPNDGRRTVKPNNQPLFLYIYVEIRV